MKTIITAINLLICSSLFSQIDTTAAFQAPFSNTTSGTFYLSGNFKSTNPAIPCITVNYGATVILKDVYCLGQGECIHANGGSTIVGDNILCRSLPPISTAQRKWGIYAYQPDSIQITHFDISNTGGSRYEQQKSTVHHNIVLKYGVVNNIERRNGYGSVTGTAIAPGIQITHMTNLGGSKIQWCTFINKANQSSIEDGINLMDVKGDSISSIDVSNNLFDGGFPYPFDSVKYSGARITTDYQGQSSYIHVHNNVAVRFANAAYNMPNGDHVIYDSNRAVTAGYILMNNIKSYYPMAWSPVCMWNIASPALKDSIARNYLGGYNKGGKFKYNNRQDENQQSTNVMIRGLNYYFPDREITTADEDSEVNAYQAKVIAAGLTIGVTYKGQTSTIIDTTKIIPCIPTTVIKDSIVYDTLPRIHDTLFFPAPYPVHDTMWESDSIQYYYLPNKPINKVVNGYLLKLDSLREIREYLVAKHEESIV